MRAILFIIVFACLVLPTHAQTLLQHGEKVLFSFSTNNHKRVVLASGAHDKYLVYRYGTDGKVELQYPSVPDTLSWRKFSYSGIIRGQGFDGTGALDLNFFTFCEGHYRYIVYETSYENSDYAVGIKIQDTVTQKQTNIHGNYKTRHGSLSIFRSDDRVSQGFRMYED